MKGKYMILCVAGQSNAVGYDESPVTADYLARFDRSRIAQLGLYGEDNLRVIPLGACAQNVQDMRPYGHPSNHGVGTKGIHLPLAHLLLPRIPQAYDILVIACAHGGTGFTVGESGAYDGAAMRPAPGPWRWGEASNYAQCMRDRIAYALDLNSENRFLGVVWCQGEHDSGDPAGQKRGFEAMTEAFFRFFGERYPGRVYKGDWNRSVWYNHETVAYWYDLAGCRAIWENYRRWSPETYVAIPRDTDSNEENGTGITARVRAQHFGNDAFERVVAPRVAQAMAKRLAP
ncbi:MAG: hypothetical protein ACI4O4_10510 [Candidatus Ventricola sp.]